MRIIQVIFWKERIIYVLFDHVLVKMSDTKYSVTWDAYQKSICNGFSSLQQRGAFVDMTLAADGHHVKVHQMVMSLVSPYLSDLIASAACPHPVIFLNSVSYETLQCILQYAYTGEVVVSNDKIQEFFNICKELHIRGMEDCTNSLQPVSDSEQAPAPTHPAAPLHSHTIPKERDRNKLFKDPLDDETSPVKEEIRVDDSLHMDDDTDYQSDNNVKPITTLCRTKMGSKTTAKTDDISIKYSVSNQGTVQILFNRFIYCFKYKKKLKGGETMWRCVNVGNKCSARISVKHDRVVKRAHAHNHPYHDAQILKRVKKRNIYTTIRDAEEAIHTKKRQEDDNAKIEKVAVTSLDE